MSAESISRATAKAVHALITTGARVATVYLSDRLTVRVARVRFRGKVQRGDRRYDLSLTIGRPNYAAREFIKKAKRAGEPFPIKKVRLQ